MAQSRAKATGKGKPYSFIQLPKHILDSDEYTELTAFEVKLLIDLFSQFNGKNNGDFCAAWSIMARKGWKSRDTKDRALQGLLYTRFIQKTKQGGKHKASLYAVTWLPINDCKGKLDVKSTRVQSNAWRR